MAFTISRPQIKKSRWSGVLVLFMVFLLGADRPPWRARRRKDIQPNRMASMRVSPQDWPPEPQSPSKVDPDALAAAMRQLCGWMPPQRKRSYAEWILQYAGQFGVDPFLLGALIYRESRCRPKKEELGGVGLTLLSPDLYQAYFKKRVYHYQVKNDGRWEQRTLPLPDFPFNIHRLLYAQSNLYFAAAMLSVWRDQHDTVDREFEQVPHRHYISHFVWGDRVKSARAEDRILSDRRRLLQYYGAIEPMKPVTRQGLMLGSPLDGAPRVVSSALGSIRESGRPHRGVDIESEYGEIVRAIATGRVLFSGVDLPGNHHNLILPEEQTNTYPRREMGRGGRFICINHVRTPFEPLTSCYMHLESVEVGVGDDVILGQLIGTVGRTGMKRSAPHLHLELRTSSELLDGLQMLRGFLIGRPQDAPELHKPKYSRRK